MTTKVKGTEGIEFPDSSVQASAAYSKAETDAKYDKGPAFTGTINSQTVGTSFQILTVNEVTDSDNCFSNNKFTPNVPGWYQINLNISTNQNDNWTNASIGVNGASGYRVSVPGAPAGVGGGGYVEVSALVYMNGTADYVQAFGSISIAGFSVVSGSFSGFLARRAS